MTTRVGRTVRLSALALATGTVVVSAATGAHAAPTAAAPNSFGGTTASAALDLSILKNIPGAPTSFGPIDATNGLVSLQLLPASATLASSASGKPATQADSTISLLGGTLASLADAGGMPAPSATSSLASPGPNKASGAVSLPDPLSLGPVGSASIPALTASSTASPLSTTSSGTGVDLSALTLSDLTDTTQVQAGCTTLTGEFSSLLGSLSSALSGVPALPSLPTLPIPLPSGAMLPSLNDLTTALQTAQTEASNLCNQLLNGAAVAVQGLQSSSTISKVGSQEVSTAHVELGSVTLFGGLFSVAGFDNTVTAKAGGTPGTASFTPDVTNGGFGKVTFAGDTAALDATGLTTDFSGLASLAPTLSTVITSLESGLTALNAQLTSAGGLIQVSADTPTGVTVATDGTSATGMLSGASLAVNVPTSLPSGLPTTAPTGLPTTTPTGLPTTLPTTLPTGLPTTGLGSLAAHAAGSANVLTLDVGQVGASAEAKALTSAAAAGSTPTTVAGETNRLAYTGADLPITGGVATLLVVGGAYAARRRRSARSAEDI